MTNCEADPYLIDAFLLSFNSELSLLLQLYVMLLFKNNYKKFPFIDEIY